MSLKTQIYSQVFKNLIYYKYEIMNQLVKDNISQIAVLR